MGATVEGPRESQYRIMLRCANGTLLMATLSIAALAGIQLASIRPWLHVGETLGDAQFRIAQSC
jgi:hypothetical protein